MKFKQLYIIILGLVVSSNVMAQEASVEGSPSVEVAAPPKATPSYPEPATITLQAPKDYYRKSYGYNTKQTCSGTMCLPTGSEVGCSYSYQSGGILGTQVQICNLKNIKKADGTIEDVSKKNFMMVTGIIDANGGFSGTLPDKEVLLVKRSWGRWKQKTFEPAAQPTPGTAQDPQGMNAGVCAPGVDCPTETNKCEGMSELDNLICMTDGFKNVPTPEATPEPEVIDYSFDREKIGQAFNRQPYGKVCEGFINKEGNLGAWGKAGVEEFKKVCNECFFGEKSIDVKDICPKFKNFSQTQKEYFWAWTLASMAYPESTCRVQVRVKGTKVRGHQEYAVGILQLEESSRRRRGRGHECQPKAKESLYTPRFQFRCAASIIQDTRYDEGRPLWGSANQYWQKLRGLGGEGGRISKYISQFPGCR
ncbi:MAG: hypothetical protein V4596_08705 [Bdellovibrionota bacterium]